MKFFNRLGRGNKEQAALEKRILELESEADLLKHDLIHDPMTGLKTKSFFEQECQLYLSIISKAASSTRRETFGYKSLSLIFFDIDHFKKVNDTYGHQVGDVVLTQIGKTIGDSFREEDTVARWGGEEFVVALLGAEESDAKKKADEVREKISRLMFEVNSTLKLTISAGVACATKGMDYAKLLKRADVSLYQAKEGGRNKVVAYSELKYHEWD